ncbi:MAG: hypothetical protein J6B87_00475 [Clostridia bacterium]|nr:hypothetical protein [Clostridia bacterium]
MKNNKNIKFLIILVVAILLLILLISIATNLVKSSSEKKGDIITDKVINDSVELPKEDEEKINKYDIYMENTYINSLSIEQRKSLIDLIDEVLEAINTKNYTLLYSKLDYLYIDSKFPTQKDFEDYINSITYGATDYTCTYYNAEYYGYECLFTSKSQETRFEIKINPSYDFLDYKLTFRKDLIGISERLTTFYVNGITGIIEYEYECKDSLEYITTIQNTSKKSITCSFSESTAESDYRGTAIHYKLISPTENLNLAPGEEKEIVFVFDVKSTENIRPSYLNISCNVDEKTETDVIYVDSIEDDIGL